MWPNASNEEPAHPSRPLGFGAAVAACLLLAGCQSAGDLADKFFSARTPNTPKNLTVLDESVLGTGYCPTIKVRPGTESLVQYVRNEDPTGANVRFQQTITRTARECRYIAGQLNLKIGVAGRVAAGPKGGPGKLAVPVRIVILKGEDVAYSELQKVEVELTAPQLATDFARVVEIPVASGPNENDVQILIGFDDQPPGKKRS
jgi:hypothetical protein